MILQIEQLETLGIWEVGASLEVGMGNGGKGFAKAVNWASSILLNSELTRWTYM